MTSRTTDHRVARRDLGKGVTTTRARSEAHDPRAWVYSEVDQLRLAAPVERGRPVPRLALVDQLANRSAVRIVSIAAPAGYGKTTLLCQWLGVERRPVVWITCGWADGDPVVFMRTLSVALDRDESLPEEVFDALDSPLRAPAEALRRLRAALAARTTPFVLVFDDAHRLSSGEVSRSVSELATAMPDDCTLVLAGRVALDILVGRLRMEGGLVELGPSDLGLSFEQSQAMLREMGVRVDRSVMRELYERTEGWAAGLKLAALGISGRGAGPESGPAAPNVTLRPGDRYLAEYLTEEVLSFVDPGLMPFLRESCIFERMSGPLCDSVLGRDDSAALLEHMARTRSFFVVALDAERHWYQYHHLFAELLREELQRTDPRRFETVNQRASDWFEERGDPDAAVRHAVAAGDRDRAGDLILTHAMALTSRGRNATVGLWLAALDERWIREVPALAFAGALYAISAHDLGALERHLDAARRLPDSGPLADGTPSLTVGVAMVTAIAGRFGVEETARYTDVVRAAGHEANPWWALATGLQGAADVLMGNLESGKTLLEDALDDLRLSPHWCTLAHAWLALVALEQGDRDRAVTRVEDARSVAEECGLESLPTILLVWSVAAKVEALVGDSGRAAIHAERARKQLDATGDFRGFGSRLQLLAPVCLAEAFVALGDLDAAREMWIRADAAGRGSLAPRSPTVSSLVSTLS